MAGRQKNDTTIQFLIYSFIGLLIFSIVIFSILGIYMSQKSRKAVYKVGEIYMSGMNEQMSRHFETVIKLRFDQVSGIVSVVSTDNNDKEALYEELIYRAQVRDFDYLALCSAEGNFETLYGHPIQPLNPEPFVEALLQSEQRVAVGVDSDENEVVLFGVDAAYPMQNGDKSTGLIAAVPLEYITDFLSLEDKGQLMYYHIIRPDGSFVIQNPNTELWPFFEELQKHLALEENDSSEENSIDEFGIALKDHKKYAATFEVNGEERQIYGIPLPYSEWYLVAVMPYGILDDTINSLSSQRMVMTLLSCASVLFILTLIFLRYYSMTRSQLHELEKARQTALESSKAKSEFLANMSHDIRTPMNAILGMAAVAEHNLDNRDKLKDCLLKIHTSGDHLLELINAVLDMSKIESGSVCLVENPFSLSGMMEEVAQIIQTDIGQKGQHLFVRLEGLVHDAVHGDMVRVKEILLNLLSNAVKYTPENGTIKVSLEEKLSSRSGVGCFEFIVEDDGIGMTQAFQEKMFTPFERAEDERVSQTQGTGLGLPITLNLVQMMNGTIQVESHLNKGTRFVVTIYLKLVMDQDKTHSQDREPPVKAPRAFRPGTRILLAEDNELNREIVKELLSLCGLEITCAANGREAVELFEENPPGTFGLILMDIQMPVLDGYGATMAIRRMGADQRRPDGAGIPIIALTANAFADDAYKAKQAGMNEHVTKPLDLDRLLETMHRWMD